MHTLTHSLLVVAGSMAATTVAVASPPWQPSSGADTLRFGTPESVGLLSSPLTEMVANITGYNTPANYQGWTFFEVNPIEPGSAVIGLSESDDASVNNKTVANSPSAHSRPRPHDCQPVR